MTMKIGYLTDTPLPASGLRLRPSAFEARGTPAFVLIDETIRHKMTEHPRSIRPIILIAAAALISLLFVATRSLRPLQPRGQPPTLNTVKAGRAIPIKFSLGGDQGLGIFAEGYPRSGPIPSDPGAREDDIEQIEAAAESSLSYDPTTGQYIYVWKTEKAWSREVRRLVLKLDDGSEHTANFAFDQGPRRRR